MSSLLETSLPASEPVALGDALLFLKQPANTPDSALIQSLWLPAARRYIESLTGLCLANRSFTQYEERFPITVWPFYFDQSRAPTSTRQDQRVRLLRCPVTAVKKLVYVGADGNLHGMLPGQDFVVDYAARPAHITPLAGQDWPALLLGQFWPELFFPTEFWSPSINGLNRVQISFTAGFTPNATDTEDIEIGAQWQPYQSFGQYSYIVDQNGNLEVQMTAPGGTTGSDLPTYAAIGASSAPDGTCVWFNAGPAGISSVVNDSSDVDSDTTIAPPAYQTGHVYPAPSIILDGNGNIQFTLAGLTSGGSPPTWATGVGAATADNGGTWINLGPAQASGPEFAASGGSGGLVLGPNQLVEYQGDTGIPEDLKLAIMMMLAHLYFNREPVVGGFRGESATDVPHSVSAICNNHRVWDFGPNRRW